MKISELSHRTGLSKDTLRFYEKVQLLPPAPKLENGYRDYPEDWVDSILLLMRARELGFTLEELKVLSGLFYQQALSPREMGRRLKGKLTEIDARILRLQTLRQDIETALAGQCAYGERLFEAQSRQNGTTDEKGV